MLYNVVFVTPIMAHASFPVSGHRRRIDWWRLVRALDVAPPEDLSDPDRYFLDQLPQPYRLIVNVLEAEV